MADVIPPQQQRGMISALLDSAECGASTLSACLLTELINAAPVASFVIDDQHVITHWNAACEQILGRPALEMVGTRHQWMPFYATERPTLADLIVEGKIDDAVNNLYREKKIRRSTTVRDAYEAEDFFPSLGGRWLHFTASPIRDNMGRIIGAMETLQDVTEKRLAADALRRSNQRLEQLVAERTAELAAANVALKASLADVENASRMKSAFQAALSHEFKTPLNAILGFADLIALETQAPETVGFAELIRQNGEQLFNLLSDVLMLSEIEAGMAQVASWEFPPEEMVGVVVQEFRKQAETQGVALNVELQPNCPAMVTGDGKRIKHVLHALLSNALEHTEHGSVTVRLDGDAGQLAISVTDTGAGIAPEKLPKLFDKFGKIGHDARNHTGGIGLGLALVRAEVELMGGTVSVLSEPGKGTQFDIRLPTTVAVA